MLAPAIPTIWSAASKAIPPCPLPEFVAFNVRYSTETNADEIKQKIVDVIDKEGINYNIAWKHSGEPFLTTEREFMDICKESIKDVTELDTVVGTNGGTSDGRFMAKVCNQIIELGLTNRSIHKINESVKEDDLEVLKNIYKAIKINISVKKLIQRF